MEFTNFNPGLVPNDCDGKSCFLACSQMVFRTKPGLRVPSLDELSAVINRRSGRYSWEYGMLAYFYENGFEVRFLSLFDLERFTLEGSFYMHEFFGDEAAQDQIENLDMELAIKSTRKFLESDGVQKTRKIPQLSDVRDLLSAGFYLVPYVNQRILQADAGYVAHTIFIYGFSSRGVRIHNPGPPATEGSEIAWDLFDKAWSSPRPESRILFAIRPSDTEAGTCP